jgi:hypothetical protein
VTLVVADGQGEGWDRGVHIIDVGARANNRLLRMTGTVGRMMRAVRSLQPDLVHFHDPELIPIGLRLKRAGLRVVYDAHEDLPRQILAKYWVHPLVRPLASRIVERLEDFAALRFDAIVAANPLARQRFERLGANTVGICNYPILGELTREVAWESRDVSVCYVGNITRTRGIGTLITAMPQTGAQIDLVGPWGEPGLREEMRRLPGWAQVVEHGFLHRNAIAKVMANCRVGLVTLLPTPAYLEALPVKLFEYMDAGLPVVVSNFPIWREIVEKADCGLLVNPEDPSSIAQAIIRLLSDDSLAQRFGENGRRAVREQYNWRQEAKKLLSLYDTLAGEMSPRGKAGNTEGVY